MKMIILSMLLTCSGVFAAKNGQGKSFKCMEIVFEENNYVYCPHNGSLYSPVSVSKEKLSILKKKLQKLKRLNMQVESEPSSNSSVKSE